MSNDFNELFGKHNDACKWYGKHRDELARLVESKWVTLVVAAAYNAGYDEAARKLGRNLTCHTLPTKKD